MNEPSSLTTNDTMPPLLPFQKSASGNRRNEIADDAGSTKPDDDGSERMDGTLRRTFETKVSLEDGSSVGIEVEVTEETVARVESHPMGLLDKYLKHQILTPSTAKPDIDLSGHTSCPTITSHVFEDFVERPAASPPRSHHQHDVATRLLGPNSGNNDIAAAACYLVYEPDSSGRLVEHYSMTSAEGAVGRWEAGGGQEDCPVQTNSQRRPQRPDRQLFGGGAGESATTCVGLHIARNYMMGPVNRQKGAFSTSISLLDRDVGTIATAGASL